MSTDLLITIGIVTYNRAGFIGMALASALQQTDSHYEIIVYDDGSTDDTKAVVAAFSSSKIRYIQSPTNHGRPYARNRAIEAAKGLFILWLDDDDCIDKSLLSEYRQLLKQNPQPDILYCNLQAIDYYSGQLLGHFSSRDYAGKEHLIPANLIQDSGITSRGALIRKSIYTMLGGFDERFQRAQDYEFWYRAAPVARFCKLDKTLYTIRVHQDNVSTQLAFKKQIDHSYKSLAIRESLHHFSLRQLFPLLNWRDIEMACETACIRIGTGLLRYHDYFNATRFLVEVPNIHLYPKTSQDFIEAYIKMGDPIGLKLAIANTANAPHHLRETLREKYGPLHSAYFRFLADFENAFQAHQYSRARTLLKQFYQSSHYTFDVAYGLGRLFEALGDMPRAKRYIAQASLFNPGRDDVFQHASRLLETPQEIQKLTDSRRRFIQHAQENRPLYLLDNLTVEKLPRGDNQALAPIAVSPVLQSSHV